MSWTTDMTELFADLVSEFGDTLTYQSSTMDCVKTPIRSAFNMMPTNMEKVADTDIDVRRSDAATAGLYALIVASNPAQKRPLVTVDGKQYEVGPLENDDTANPIVRLKCRLLQ